MFRNYFKIAVRNLVKNKAFSIINILGLSFGLACTMLIGLWIMDEMSIDKFHNKRLYKVLVEIIRPGEKPIIWTTTPVIASRILNEAVPGVENAIVATHPTSRVVINGSLKLEERGVFADSTIFQVFDYPMLYGNKENLFKNLNDIVVSQELAIKLFKTTDVLGKTIELIDLTRETYEITGVYDIPANSSNTFDFVISFSKYKIGRDWVEQIGNFNDETFLILDEKSDPATVASLLTQEVLERFPDDDGEVNSRFVLYPYEDLYLKSDFENWPHVTGRIQYVRLFTLVGIIIMVIACINFMNLSTAQAGKRAKEVGIRKTVGARKGALVGQFIGESLIITSIAALLALTMADLLMPAFNNLIEKDLSLPFSNGYFIGILLFAIVCTGLVAGSYPALYLSSFEPATVLKGKFRSNRAMGGIRKVLVVFQFTLSITLIISTVIIYSQIKYINTIDLGVDKEHVMYHSLGGNAQERLTYKTEVEKLPGVKNVAFSNFNPLMIYNSTNSVNWNGKTAEHNFYFHVIQTDDDFVPTFDLNVIKGNNFSNSIDPKDTVGHFLLNQKAVEMMGLENPVGTELAVWGSKGRVEGILEDWNHETLYAPIEPVVVYYTPYASTGFIKLTGHNIEGTIKNIESLYKTFESDKPFAYRFIEDDFNKTYKSVTIAGVLSNIFAVIAIFVSCLGLYGLASFMTEQRRKETGIRKVMGASAFNLTTLFSKDFVKLVIISFLLASPIAYYITDGWLKEFQFHIKPSLLMFLSAGILAVLIAIVTVSFQTIKAALSNPIKSLRYE